MRSLPVLIALLVLAGCDATAEGPPETPGVVAPEAFAFEPGFPAARGALAGENFNNGAVRVGVVSAIIGVNLLLPSAATHAATRTQPFVDDGVWIWESTFNEGEDEVTFRLEGEPAGREVRWGLSITNRDYTDFTLYTARTDFDGESGDWRLFYDIDGERTEVLRADFEVRDGDTRELTYSVPPGRDAAGSSVRYVHDGTARVFDWRQEPEGRDHLVEWDAVTLEGSIQADTYRDGERSCWDGTLADVECPGAAR